MNSETIPIKKQFELSNKEILEITKIKEGYKFILYSNSKEILYNGILKTETNLSNEQILKELFAYFNINENEIRNIKSIESSDILETPLTIKSEIIEY